MKGNADGPLDNWHSRSPSISCYCNVRMGLMQLAQTGKDEN